jgi:hypothetical protein
VTIDPDAAAIFAAFAGAVLAGAPRVQRSLARRRRAARKCLACGRSFVLGERTCDCEAPQ